jgi:hypothetical protein
MNLIVGPSNQTPDIVPTSFEPPFEVDLWISIEENKTKMSMTKIRFFRMFGMQNSPKLNLWWMLMGKCIKLDIKFTIKLRGKKISSP